MSHDKKVAQVTKIQSLFRQKRAIAIFSSKLHDKRLLQATILIQSHFRRLKTVKHKKVKLNSIVNIQSHIRRMISKKLVEITQKNSTWYQNKLLVQRMKNKSVVNPPELIRMVKE
jgi:hypothetical protein